MENPQWTDYTTLLEGRPNCWCSTSFTCFRAERKKKKKRTILTIQLLSKHHNPSFIWPGLQWSSLSCPSIHSHTWKSHKRMSSVSSCSRKPSAHLQTCSGVSLCRPSNSVGFKAVWVPTTMLYLVSKETFSNLGAWPSVRSVGKKNVAGIGIKDWYVWEKPVQSCSAKNLPL